MAKPFVLQPLLNIMHERVDEATRQLGQLIAGEQNAKSRLQLIEQYRAEYAERFRQAAEQGLTPLAWRNYQDFLNRLDEAIAQQQGLVDQAAQSTAVGQANWREQNKRLQAIDTLSQRHDARERYQESKRDQKQQDEFNSRKFGTAKDE